MRQKLKKTKRIGGNLMWTFTYTYVEENRGTCIMEGLLSTNAEPEEVMTILLKQVIDPSMSNIFMLSSGFH